MATKRILMYIVLLFLLGSLLPLSGFAQEASPTNGVTILESALSNTSPVVGDTLRYTLKFEYPQALEIVAVDQFTENGLDLIAHEQRDPQRFNGRIIQQHEYTLRAREEGESQFRPISLQFSGPRKDPVVALTDPVHLNVLPAFSAQVVTNSPVMLHEAVELRLSLIKRKPVTVTAMPHEIEAVLQIPQSAESTPQAAATPAASPPEPARLRFELDQSQQIVPQQGKGQTTEEYTYRLATPPEQAGEYRIAPLSVTYRTATGEELEYQVKETSLFVLNPNTANQAIATDYHFLLLPALLATALLVGCVGTLLYRRYRKNRRRAALEVAPTLPPGEIAYQELEAIRAQQLPARGEFKTYYRLLSETLRKFLGAEYQFHVLERTTEEIQREIQRRDIPEQTRRRIQTFLPEADMVKFAKYLPSLTEADSAEEQVVKIVDESLAYHRPPELPDASAVTEPVLSEPSGD